MKFGDYLKIRRAELGWTQPEAAMKAGIEQSYLSKLETGKSAPSGEVYHRLVEAYGIDTDTMTGVLLPAELERLREIESVREAVLRQDREARSGARRWLLCGLVALALGGGLLGLSRIDAGGVTAQYSYQSTGIVRAGESLDVFSGVNEQPDPESKDYADRVNARDALIARVDDRIQTSETYRGPVFIENVPGGKRVWSLAGKFDVRVSGRYQWATVPALALLLGALGCFFISWRWPRGWKREGQ